MSGFEFHATSGTVPLSVFDTYLTTKNEIERHTQTNNDGGPAKKTRMIAADGYPHPAGPFFPRRFPHKSGKR